MGRWKTTLLGAAGALSLLIGSAGAASADEGGTLLAFTSMTPVTGPAVGTVNDRGITGGGKAWQIASGSGTLTRDGHLQVTVTGLVIPALGDVNPLGHFAAIVSCRTPRGGVTNVLTAPVTTNPAGDATIDAMVALPHPCIQPIVFVTSATGAWFAMSNRDGEEGDD